jgi:hypothetical protein
MEDDAPEPGPASKPPEDVEIPDDSVYGSNEPLAPIQEETKEPNHSKNQSTKPQNNTNQRNSIKIGLIPILLLTLLLLGGSGAVGYLLGQKTPTKQQRETQTQTQNETERKDPKNQSKQASAFTPDRGIYRKANSNDSRSLAKRRIDIAQNRIIWITDSPDSQRILPLLAAKKNKDAIPIFILTGKETPQVRLANASEYNMPITQLNLELETPYSILLIDDRLVVDISRSNWLWESKEPKILEETKAWIQELIENQTTQ